MAILGGDSVSSSNSQATNQISFNPIISALTGTGADNPSVYGPQTLTPTATSTATQSNPATASLYGGGGLGGLLGTSTTPARTGIGAGQVVPGYATTDPNAISVKTNANTMIWVLMFGGMAMILMMGGGGRRH